MAVNAIATGAWTIQSTNNALSGRLHDLIPLVKGASLDPSTARSGVYPTVSDGTPTYQDLLVAKTGATGTLTCTINIGGGVINRSGQGPYEFYNQTQKTVTLTAANGSNPRIDRISARLYDLAQGDTVPGTLPANGGVQLEVTDGTPAGSPSPPALPANSIPLAQVLVPTSAANSSQLTVTDLRSGTGIYGAHRPMLAADLTVFTGAGSTQPQGFATGEILDGNGLLWRWDGGAWRQLITTATLTYTPTFTMATANGTATGRVTIAGKMAMVQATFAAAAGVSLGTGNITFTVPYTSANISGYAWQGQCLFGGGNGYINNCTINSNSATATIFAWSNNAGQVATPGNAGVAFVSGNTLTCNLVYEIA